MFKMRNENEIQERDFAVECMNVTPYFCVCEKKYGTAL